jgi:hypothetical protein
MTDSINEAARALGRKGGASKSAAKQAASRANLAAARKCRHAAQPVTITIERPAPMAPEKLRAIVSAHLPKVGEHTEPVRLPIFDELDQRESGE